MREKQELKNFIDHYGIGETLDALSDILIENYQDTPKGIVICQFLDDMNSEFEPESAREI